MFHRPGCGVLPHLSDLRLGGEPAASGVEAQLAYFAEHAAGWWAITFLMVVTDLLLVPIYIGIYLARMNSKL